MPLASKPVALTLLVAAMAACGGGNGSDDDGGAGQPPPAATGQRQLDLEIAYDNALDTCSQYPAKDIAAIYGVKNEPKAIADAVAAQEQDPELREEVRKGCLAAFEQGG